MKQLTCEMCGSTDLMKQDGVFVCQSCGTKYSVEEAKKMMVEGTVEIAGTVKVDNSNKLDNLFALAHRAKNDGNSENAAKYYEQILTEDPNSWEAAFYSVYFKASNCVIGNISSAANSVSGCLKSTFRLIKEYVPEEKQQDAYKEVYNNVYDIGNTLWNAAWYHYLNYNSADSAKPELITRTGAIYDMWMNLGNLAQNEFNDKESALKAYKHIIDVMKPIEAITNRYPSETLLSKIRELDSLYVVPTSSSGGCYVATAVYGSYDCPQVWTLRRYRDYTLSKTWYGRAFIRTYYAISPTVVKWFGHTEWFKNMWKGKLDRMVANLNAEGVEDTPYEDRNW